MCSHRLAEPSDIQLVSVAPPFSNFDYVDHEFDGVPSIRRLFSQARSYGCQTLVVETIPPIGVIAEDDAELASLFPDFQRGGLKRVSFWKTPIENEAALTGADSRKLLGFAILKRDVVPSRATSRWYVFESVLIKYPHEHNCVRGSKAFHVRVGGRDHSVTGVLYCQQDGLNKSCAQVALRALLGTHFPDRSLSYREINQWASGGASSFEPWNGLNVQQIRRVLDATGVKFLDIDYGGKTPEEREGLPPYQKLVYAGIESGAGALLGFRLRGEGLTTDMRHIIPFFGHTFNQDTWVPHAEAAYFHVGEETRYLPSEAWVSSFIGHDDNFGSNFCVPRHYIGAEQADYVVELLPDGCVYSGSIAEAVAVDYLYSILPELHGNSLPWLGRLVGFVATQQVVLRAICLTAEEYAHHWGRAKDWEGRAENRALLKTVKSQLPQRLWMVEVSAPELFPANLRKVGEIVLDATVQPTSERDFRLFVCARVPGSLLVLKDVSASGIPSFASVGSNLQSHTALFGCERRHSGGECAAP